MDGWQKTHGRALDRIFDHELETFEPHTLLTFGARQGTGAGYGARLKDCRIAFCLYNLAYLGSGVFSKMWMP
jgi:hypothetical protein